jgi:hypothetical protein
LDGLSKELQDPVWQSDNASELATLRKNRDLYASVASSLINDDGTAAEWAVWFVPPDQAQEADTRIITIFRTAQVSFGSRKSVWEDLSRLTAPMALGSGTVDSPVKISFRKLENVESSEVNPVNYGSWGLPQLIHGDALGRPERLDNGVKWRFRIKLNDRQQSISGNATFEAVLKRPLPKMEDWPN